MFIAIGRGEHMGSGADTINKGRETKDWPDLEIKEHFGKNDDRVELTLWLQDCLKNGFRTFVVIFGGWQVFRIKKMRLTQKVSFFFFWGGWDEEGFRTINRFRRH